VQWNWDTTYLELPGALFSLQPPTPVQNPEWVLFNERLAKEKGLGTWEPDPDLFILSGNRSPLNTKPFSQAYSGHQFGHFVTLGDGRAVVLGECVTKTGDRFDVQLKGSGPTPYSRRGDGRAALGPMLREFVLSEAMAALGIPTTRSLAVVSTGEPVFRDSEKRGAILTRLASSHIRVGTFQYASALQSVPTLKALADYTLQRHFPEALRDPNPYEKLIEAVAKKQGELVAQWLLVGFIHGVMNTDNMALSGETIDYGPCAFMDAYDPGKVFSSIDRNGRYAFANQPSIALWNLQRFAEALLPLLGGDKERAQNALEPFATHFESRWLEGMRNKIGLIKKRPEDTKIILDLLEILHRRNLDYTRTFRYLSEVETTESDSEWHHWHRHWKERALHEHGSIEKLQQYTHRFNPAVIARNHRVEEALEAAEQGNLVPLHRLLSVLEKPFESTPEGLAFEAAPGPEQAVYQTFCGT
jgi:serine/tyrosine/threonine adenylyltransferase